MRARHLSERVLHRGRACARRGFVGCDGEKRRTGAADGAAECARVERRTFDVVELGDERCAARLGIAIVQCPAKEVSIRDGERVRERGRVGHLLDPLRARTGVRQQCARVLRLNPHSGCDQGDPPVGADGQLHDVDRIEAAGQREPSDGTRGDVVEVAARDRGLALQRRGDHIAQHGGLSEGEGRGVGAGDARRRASAHSAGERESFVDRDDRVVTERPEMCVGGDCRTVPLRIARDELCVPSGDVRDLRRAFGQLDRDRVADAIDREAEHVEAGADVADAAGSEGGGAHHCDALLRTAGVSPADARASRPSAALPARRWQVSRRDGGGPIQHLIATPFSARAS